MECFIKDEIKIILAKQKAKQNKTHQQFKIKKKTKQKKKQKHILTNKQLIIKTQTQK